MTTVQTLLGNQLYDGALGIEIETESADAYQIPQIDGWKVVRDGSLRDFGQEYVMKRPVSKDNLKTSLVTWKEGLGNIHRKLRPNSISTSVHVHVNVQDMSPLEALNFYLCGILFENVMAKFAGPDRIGNLFCLRTVDAEDQYNSIKRNIKEAYTEYDLLNGFNPAGYKYSNINTVPITTQGSMEFRVMRGTIDIDEIKVWGEALHDVREFSRQFKNPVDIVHKMKELGADGLLKSALGINTENFTYLNWERDLLRNFIYVADMATCRKDWELQEYKVPERKPLKIDFAQMRARDPAMPQPPVAQGAVAWDEDFEEEDI